MRKAQDLGLDTFPMAGGGAPAAPPQPIFNVIYSPLDSLGKILADLDVKKYLMNNFGESAEDLAHKIWVMYGGSENEIDPGMKGERMDSPVSEDETLQNKIQTDEYNRTRNSRWKRLPKGVSIDEITSPESIKNTILGGFEQLAQEHSKPANAKTISKLIRLANAAEINGKYKSVDFIMNEIIKNVHTLR